MSVVEVTRSDETLVEIRALPETPEPRTREDVLLNAADLIERRGLASGLLTRDGAFCLAAAVGVSALGLNEDIDLGYRATPGTRSKVIREATRVLQADYTAIYRVSDAAIYWGDQPGRRWWQKRKSREARAAALLREVAAGASFTEAARTA